MKKSRTVRWASSLAIGALVLSACTNDPGGETDGGVPPLTIHANSYNSYQANFNPFSAAVLHGTRGFIYEPLIINTPMQPNESTPWLAESLEFNGDGSSITLELREGVEWSDGETFDAEDVAYTFNQMVEHPATNRSAFPVVGSTVVDEYTVDVEFEEPMYAQEAAIGNTLMVPEHIWSDFDDPVEHTNEEPVGTGPFALDEFGQQLYTLAKNDGYWNAGEIEVEEIRYPANTEQTFTTALQNGELDWSGGFVSNVDEIYVAHDEENRGYWYPGGGLVALTPNLENEIFNDVALREAMNMGLDREQISNVAMQGYAPVAHPTGLPLPAYEDALSDEYRDEDLAYSPDTANEILDGAGYERGDDGIRVAPDGTRLSWSLEIPSSYADWVDIAGLVEEQYAEIGIEVVPQGISFEAWVESRNNGNFDITLAAVPIGLTPYDMFDSIMSSEHANPDGSVTSNFSRFYSDEADKSLNAVASTDDPAEQQAALDELQRIMVEEIPTIPVVAAPNWFQYNTARWEGFPSEDDPYAFGAPYQSPDNLLTVHNLTLAD